jgi:hypothetical protein
MVQSITARLFATRATGLASPFSIRGTVFDAVVEHTSSVRHCQRERAKPHNEKVEVQE